MNPQPGPATDTPQAAAARVSRPRRIPSQPPDLVNVSGALLRLSTLAVISGRSISSLYRAIDAGELTVVRNGLRCTRVTSENARAFLALLAKGAA